MAFEWSHNLRYGKKGSKETKKHQDVLEEERTNENPKISAWGERKQTTSNKKPEKP